MGAHSHDAIRLDHKHDNMALTYLYIQESEEVFTQDAQDSEDQTTQAIYANFAGILGGKLSTMYIYQADGCGGDYATLNNGACSGGANDIHTIGFRQAGQLFGLDYRGEYYYQFGDAQGWAARSTRADADNGGYANDGSDVDREAYMFGIRVGKQFKNVSMKPKLTLWYDYLSGTSDEDRGNNKMKSFQTVYDTGHKFYGLQDLFLGLGTGDCGGGTCGLGLQDVAIKAQINPVPGWTVKTAFHHFSTAEGIAGSPVSANVSAAASTTDSSVLGQELDITVVNKYNANTKIMMGYSHFTQAAGLRSLRTTYGTDDANWFYTQVHVNF
jgi:hypothetical protein